MDRSRRPAPPRTAASRAATAAALVAGAIALGGCAHPLTTASRCDAGARPTGAERLYFGTQRPGGLVSDVEWNAFVDDTIAPRFPAGFTTWDAAGGWRGADGHALREASHVLEVMHPAGTAADAAITATIAAYVSRFEQEAVLRVRVPACVSP
jgi:hypothetical protein